MSLFPYQLKCPSEMSDSGFDSFGCNTSDEGEVTHVSELDEHLGKMLLIEGDETNDNELVALLKNVMAQEKARDLETIKSQKEQITLLWNELKRNHDVIDKILEQNSLLNTIMYRDSRLMQKERQNEPVIASESIVSVRSRDTVSSTTVTKEFNEDNRLLMYLRLFEEDVTRLNPYFNWLPYIVQFPIKISGKVLKKCALQTCYLFFVNRKE